MNRARISTSEIGEGVGAFSLALVLHLTLGLLLFIGAAKAPLPTTSPESLTIELSLADWAVSPVPQTPRAEPATLLPPPRFKGVAAIAQTPAAQTNGVNDQVEDVHIARRMPDDRDHPEPPKATPVVSAAPTAVDLPSAAVDRQAVAQTEPSHSASAVASAPRFDAAYLSNPPPVYPPLSRRLREEGRVLLYVHVLATGAAAEVELRQSSGYERLDRAAIASVQGWRFVPAVRAGQAEAAWVLVPMVFSLRS